MPRTETMASWDRYPIDSPTYRFNDLKPGDQGDERPEELALPSSPYCGNHHRFQSNGALVVSTSGSAQSADWVNGEFMRELADSPQARIKGVEATSFAILPTCYFLGSGRCCGCVILYWVGCVCQPVTSRVHEDVVKRVSDRCWKRREPASCFCLYICRS